MAVREKRSPARFDIAIPSRGVPPVFLKSLKEKRSLLEAQPSDKRQQAVISRAVMLIRPT
jgi:hypothetical protein